MFTKSQLLAGVVIVASASSVIAGPVYSDPTEIEAREYDTMDSLEARGRKGQYIAPGPKPFTGHVGIPGLQQRGEMGNDIEERFFGAIVKVAAKIGTKVAKKVADKKRKKRDLDEVEYELMARDIFDYLDDLEARAPTTGTTKTPPTPNGSTSTPHRSANEAKHGGSGDKKKAKKAGPGSHEHKNKNKNKNKRPGSHHPKNVKPGSKVKSAESRVKQAHKDGAKTASGSGLKTTGVKTSELKTSTSSSSKSAQPGVPVKAQVKDGSPSSNSNAGSGSKSNLVTTKSTTTAAAKRELIELIARELGVYDELD